MSDHTSAATAVLPSTNASIALLLDEFADRRELAGDSPFRLRSYRGAAALIREHAGSIAVRAREGTLSELPGIGAGIAAVIAEAVETGTIAELEVARQEVPDGLLHLTRLPGIGATTARRIWEAANVQSIEQVLSAAADGRLDGIKGIRPGIVQLLASLDPDEDLPELMPSRGAAPWVRERAAAALGQLRAAVVECGAPFECIPGGSFATGAERVDELVVALVPAAPASSARTPTASVDDLAAQLKAAGWMPLEQGRWMSPAGSTVELLDGVADPANASRIWTASTLPDGAIPPAAASTASLATAGPLQLSSPADAATFVAAGLQPVPTELRHASRAWQAASGSEQDVFAELVTAAQVRGDLHCHSTWSDGDCSIAEMAAAARRRGDEYMAMTDHSAPYALVNGLGPDRLAEQRLEIEALNSEFAGEFTLLQGSEVEVLADGSLGLDDATLSTLDWVVASWHVAQRQPEDVMWARIERAVRNPLVDAIGHPTARVLGRRGPIALDIRRLIELCVETGTMLEINSNTQRLDLCAEHAVLAAEAGVLISINTDAHQVEGLEDRDHGVATARRAWLTTEQVLNTRPLARIQDLRPRNRA